jgi:hypothetical protein
MSDKQQPSPERMDKTTITMKNDQIAYLDEVCASIRRRTGSAICRSSLLRAFVQASQISRLDFSRRCSEQAIVDGFTRIIQVGLSHMTTNPPTAPNRR